MQWLCLGDAPRGTHNLLKMRRKPLFDFCPAALITPSMEDQVSADPQCPISLFHISHNLLQTGIGLLARFGVTVGHNLKLNLLWSVASCQKADAARTLSADFGCAHLHYSRYTSLLVAWTTAPFRCKVASRGCLHSLFSSPSVIRICRT